MCYKKNYREYFVANNFPLIFLRAFFGVLAMYCGFSSLIYIPLAQATTISFTKVFFVAIFSALVLKETLTLKTIFLSILGFVGIFLIVDPDEFNNLNGTILSLISSFFVALGIISTSILSKSNNSSTIVFYHSIFACLISYILFRPNIISIDVTLFVKIILVTISAILGQLFNVESYKKSQSNIIVLFSYTRIIFSFFLGYIFLQEDINSQIIFGIIIIIFTTMLLTKKY